MDLGYQSEHLAWKQRVNQEQSRTTSFYKTFGTFNKSGSSNSVTRPLFPNANQYTKSLNYKTLKYNVGYTFGGTKPIHNSILDQKIVRTSSLSPIKSARKEIKSDKHKLQSISPIKNNGENSPEISKLSKEIDIAKLKVNGKDDVARAYIKDLENKLRDERKKRIKTEIKLEAKRLI